MEVRTGHGNFRVAFLVSRDMSAFLRKCRGVLGIGLMWAIGWAAVFAALWAGIRLFDPASIDPGEGLTRIAWIGGVFGFASGAAFAVLLALADGRKTLRDLSPLRAALSQAAELSWQIT